MLTTPPAVSACALINCEFVSDGNLYIYTEKRQQFFWLFRNGNKFYEKRSNQLIFIDLFVQKSKVTHSKMKNNIWTNKMISFLENAYFEKYVSIFGDKHQLSKF